MEAVCIIVEEEGSGGSVYNSGGEGRGGSMYESGGGGKWRQCV